MATRSEAGKLGWLAARHKLYVRFDRMIEEYNKNPKLCKYCKKKIPFELKRQDFCNRICVNNFRWGSRENVERIPSGKIKWNNCMLCEKPAFKLFCCKKCERIYKFREKAKNNTPMKNTTVRQYLKDIERPYVCNTCKLNMWNEKPLPLEAHHIDGNSSNNLDENIEYICPNCHSQTPTYRGKNKGHGREYRRSKSSILNTNILNT